MLVRFNHLGRIRYRYGSHPGDARYSQRHGIFIDQFQRSRRCSRLCSVIRIIDRIIGVLIVGVLVIGVLVVGCVIRCISICSCTTRYGSSAAATAAGAAATAAGWNASINEFERVVICQCSDLVISVRLISRDLKISYIDSVANIRVERSVRICQISTACINIPDIILNLGSLDSVRNDEITVLIYIKRKIMLFFFSALS